MLLDKFFHTLPIQLTTVCYCIERVFSIPNLPDRTERLYVQDINDLPHCLANLDTPYVKSISVFLVFKPMHHVFGYPVRIRLDDREYRFDHTSQGFSSLAVYDLSGHMTKFVCRMHNVVNYANHDFSR